MTLLLYGFFFTFFWAVARGVRSELPLKVLCWDISAVSVAAMLPFSMGGIGVRDFPLIGLLQSGGPEPVRLLAISLSAPALLLISVLVGGIGPFLRGGFGFRADFWANPRTDAGSKLRFRL